MELLITEVTEMRGGQFCVGSWCRESRRMVRPLPGGENWPAALLQQHRVSPGSVLAAAVVPARRPRHYPHGTEDTVVAVDGLRFVRHDGLGGPNGPAYVATVGDAFERHVASNRQFGRKVMGAHIAAGTQTRSLWGVAVARPGLFVSEQNAKLRIRLDDGELSYQLPVSSSALKRVWHDGGIDAVWRVLPRSGTVHVRLGLARPFPEDPGKCYLMVNGLHW